MAISLKKITEMVEAQSLKGDEHFFVQIGNAFQEVPLPVITATILSTVGFPKGFADVTAAFEDREDSTQTALEYLWTLPAGNYILHETDGNELTTYQMSRLNGTNGVVSRWLFTSGATSTVELWTSAYDSGNTPLISIDGSENRIAWKNTTLATTGDLTAALNGVGIPIVKEPPESAEAGLNAYAVTGEGLPVVIRATQTQDGRPIGKGKQIVFIPEHNNTGTDPTLQLNGGDSIPIRQRASVDSNTSQNTVQITANTLIQGMPYTLTFCGVAWLIDSYLPGEGAETTATVTSVNNETGAVKVTAEKLGAALAVSNWKVVTKSFLGYIAREGNEEVTPQQYLWTRKQGCYFVRYTDGVHVLVRVDLGATQTDEETGVTSRTGPVIRLYANIPEDDGESAISGGLWIGSTQLAAISSLTDLTAISLLLNNSPLITQQELLTRLNGYVTNAGLSLTLGSYSTTQQVQGMINAALGNANSAFIAEYDVTTFAEIKTAYEAGKYIIVKRQYGNAGAYIYAGLTEVTKSGDNITSFMFAGVNISATPAVALFDPPLHLFNNGFVSLRSTGTWSFYTEPQKPEVIIPYSNAEYTVLKEYIDNGFDVLIELPEGYGTSFYARKHYLRYDASQYVWGNVHTSLIFTGMTIPLTVRTIIVDGVEETEEVEPTPIMEVAYFDREKKNLYSFNLEHRASKAINFNTINHDRYPSTLAVKNYIDANCATKTNFEAKAAQLSRAVDRSVLGTHLRKYTEVYKDETTGNDASRRRLMIQIDGAQHLADSWSSITSCTLDLMICARRRGKGYHWFHPKNYDYVWSEEEGEKGAPYGYALIAGHETNRQLGTQQNPIIEEFPAVPEWMPHDGLMETEIPLTLADVLRGYILIDVNTYFLPMIKPSFPNDCEDDDWGDVAVMGVAAFNTATPKAKPALVTWELAIDGEIVGMHHNELRIGMSRSESAVTTVAIDENGNAALQNLYTSIS